MVKKIIFIIFLLLIIFSFTSCLSIDTTVTINNDESGTVRFTYSVSTLAVDINKIDKDNNILPFPVIETEFDIAALRSGGITILKPELSDDGYRYNSDGTRYYFDDGNRYYYNIDVQFNSLEALTNFTGTQFNITNSGNNKLLTVIVRDQTSEVTNQTLNIIRENFSEDEFTFTIRIPGDIIQVLGATFSGSDVTFEISLEDLIQSTEVVQFSVEYR